MITRYPTQVLETMRKAQIIGMTKWLSTRPEIDWVECEVHDDQGRCFAKVRLSHVSA